MNNEIEMDSISKLTSSMRQKTVDCTTCGRPKPVVGEAGVAVESCSCASITAPQQTSVLDGWLRVIDEEMVGAHLGVANADDDYNTAKSKINTLILWHISVATDHALDYQPVPATNPANWYKCEDCNGTGKVTHNG